MQLDEAIEIVAYDPAWPALFVQERLVLREALAAAAASIQHIGSTAVGGMFAKPVIDILAGLVSYPADTTLLTKLAPLGYEYLGEAGVAGRQYLRKRNEHAFNLHLVLHEGEQWENNLTLRDYLRAYDDEARRYAQHKRQALAQASSLLAYSDLKSHFVTELLQRAIAWKQSSTN